MTTPNRIDFKSGTFVANGHDYYIADFITVGRDVRYTNLIPKMAFGMDFKGIMDFARQVYTNSTGGNDALTACFKNATLSMNMMDSIKNMNESGFPIYYELAAIFINRKDEDITVLTDQMVKEKIQDWEKAGIPREDFFRVAISSINGLKEAWISLTEEIAVKQGK